MTPADDLKKIVKPLWQWIIFSIARVYAGSSGVALRNFTMVAFLRVCCKLAPMATITFDTFKFVDRLEKAGLSREQAAAIVEAQREAFAEALDTSLATKADVMAVKTDVALLDAKFDKLQWMIGIVIALAVANFAKQYF